MNFVYDVMLNFNDELYDFFQWNKKDNIVRVKKIPLFKINSDDFCKLLKYNFFVDDLFLSRIKNKTEFFNRNKNIKNNYYCLISDGNDIIALKFNENAKCIKRSSLLVDEELEVLDICDRILFSKLEFKIETKREFNFKTRLELEMQDFIVNEINKLKKEKDIDKINYLYLECFGKQEKNTKLALKKISDIINSDNKKAYENLYNFFKLTKAK